MSYDAKTDWKKKAVHVFAHFSMKFNLKVGSKLQLFTDTSPAMRMEMT